MLAHCQFIMGPEVRALERELVGILRRAPRHHRRERHRRAAPRAHGQGDRTGRRRVLSGLHLLRHRRGGGAAWARRRSLSMSRRPPSTSIRRALSARSRQLAARAEAEGGASRRPVRHARRLCRDQCGRRGRRIFSSSRTPPSRSVRPTGPTRGRHAGAGDDHELLSLKAPRLLRRRRRGIHR